MIRKLLWLIFVDDLADILVPECPSGMENEDGAVERGRNRWEHKEENRYEAGPVCEEC